MSSIVIGNFFLVMFSLCWFQYWYVLYFMRVPIKSTLHPYLYSASGGLTPYPHRGTSPRPRRKNVRPGRRPILLPGLFTWTPSEECRSPASPQTITGALPLDHAGRIPSRASPHTLTGALHLDTAWRMSVPGVSPYPYTELPWTRPWECPSPDPLIAPSLFLCKHVVSDE